MIRTLAICGLLALSAPAMAQEPVDIFLRDHATATHRYVQLGEIAVLNGGPNALRQKLAEMDIDALPADGRTRTCSRAQVSFRLRLAGVPQALFTLSGAEQVLVVP